MLSYLAKITQGQVSLGSLCESLHLILVTECLNEKGWSILCCPLVLFRILAEWENYGINWHLHNCKEKGWNNVSKSPATLHYTKYDSENYCSKFTFDDELVDFHFGKYSSSWSFYCILSIIAMLNAGVSPL